MSEATHSKAPWRRDDDGILSAENDLICEMCPADPDGFDDPTSGPITEANTRLILAAPDLFKACHLFLESSLYYADAPEAFDAVKAAVAKATVPAEAT